MVSSACWILNDFDPYDYYSKAGFLQQLNTACWFLGQT